MTTHDRKDPMGDPVTAPERKPFAQFLQEARRGGLHTELSDTLAELVLAVQDTGKKGTIKLTLSVEQSKDDESIVVVNDDISVSVPKHTTKPTLFWPDQLGNLQRRDPRQAEIPGLQAVKGGKNDKGDGQPEAEVG